METTSPGGRPPVTQEQVERAIAEVASRLRGVRRSDLPDFVDRDSGYPFVRIEGETLVLLARERGRETMRQEAGDLDELLFLVFRGVTEQLAQRRRAGRSRRGQDSRRGWFALWISLMRGLDPSWGERTQVFVDEVLVVAPYRDR